jgi:hypothetical protein
MCFWASGVNANIRALNGLSGYGVCRKKIKKETISCLYLALRFSFAATEPR